MIYKQFNDLSLSALGLGCMRLPLNSQDETDINEASAAEMVRYAMENGINYFDTAWRYHGGESELVMGRILSAYPRDSFYLASKFPGFSLETIENPAAVFEEQLQKCKVEHFDFYLFHNVCERNIDWLLDPRYGVADYLIAQKKAGRIRYLGFSTHGSRAVIQKFLDAYGEELSFCQIQLNYLDWDLQSAKEKVELLNRYKIPIWVMEPVRGGRLVQLPESAAQKLDSLRPDVNGPEWAFRFLQSIEGVTMILSGMSNMEQLQENIATFADNKPLNDIEMAAIMDVAADMIRANKVPCTGCSYCTEHCRQELLIPELIKAYNEGVKPEGKGPQHCIGCRKCESVCPQGIKISEVMKTFAAKQQKG